MRHMLRLKSSGCIYGFFDKSFTFLMDLLIVLGIEKFLVDEQGGARYVTRQLFLILLSEAVTRQLSLILSSEAVST